MNDIQAQNSRLEKITFYSQNTCNFSLIKSLQNKNFFFERSAVRLSSKVDVMDAYEWEINPSGLGKRLIDWCHTSCCGAFSEIDLDACNLLMPSSNHPLSIYKILSSANAYSSSNILTK